MRHGTAGPGRPVWDLAGSLTAGLQHPRQVPLPTHKASRGWWRLGRNSVLPVEVRVAAWVTTHVTTSAAGWWSVGGAGRQWVR